MKNNTTKTFGADNHHVQEYDNKTRLPDSVATPTGVLLDDSVATHQILESEDYQHQPRKRTKSSSTNKCSNAKGNLTYQAMIISNKEGLVGEVRRFSI